MRNTTPNCNITFPFGAFEKAFKCDECGRPAEVLGVYGEHEECYCASCYVRHNLPRTTITFGKRADFDGAYVGESYYITSYNVPEELQD